MGSDVNYLNNIPGESSFIKLLLTGLLGPLDFNLGVDDVYALLGQPDRIAHEFIGEEYELTKLWYKAIALTFRHNKLFMIIIEFEKKEIGTSKNFLHSILCTDWYETIGSMNIDLFISYLKTHSIKCSQLVMDGQKENVLWISKGNLEVVFTPKQNNRIQRIISSPLEQGNRLFVDC